MRTLLGLIPLQAGQLLRYDREGHTTDQLVASYLPQINQIDRHFPIHVHEVIDSGLPKGTTGRGVRREQVEKLAEAIGLTHLLQLPIGKLSGGQLQRALLGRALASNPELLILDEHSVSLTSLIRKALSRYWSKSYAPRRLCSWSPTISTKPSPSTGRPLPSDASNRLMNKKAIHSLYYPSSRLYPLKRRV